MHRNVALTEAACVNAVCKHTYMHACIALCMLPLHS